MNPRAEEVNPRAVRPARILLVDDEQRVLRFVSRGLRAEGYVVESADNGADGLRMALTAAYDLIILNLLMPGLDGESVLRRIIRRLPSQQVMVVSCLTETATKVGCFEQGAVDQDGARQGVPGRWWLRGSAAAWTGRCGSSAGWRSPGSASPWPTWAGCGWCQPGRRSRSTSSGSA